MKLRSSIVTTLEAPPPGAVPAPTQRPQDSLDFLALPEEIRMCVYHLCLVSKAEISLDDGSNLYYVINYADDDPSENHMGWNLVAVAGVLAPAPAPPSITVNVPASFSYPSTPDSTVDFVPPPPTGSANKAVVPQIIPLASVVQPADLSRLPMAPASAKTSFNTGTGIYIGPVYPAAFSYLPPFTYTPFASFNARLLQTCKTVYAEALPVLYRKNQFTLHFPSARNPSLDHLRKGRPLAYITNLRLDVIHLGSLLDGGRSNGLWSTILRKCIQMQKLTLRFPDERLWSALDYARAIIRIAANIADMKKGTGEPIMTVMFLLENPALAQMFGANTTVQVQQLIGKKTHTRLQVPRNMAIELVGKMSVPEYSIIQGYTRKGWCFSRKSPANSSDVVHGAWVELEWIKSQQ